MSAIPAIDQNHEALKRILAMLLAMAGFAGLMFSPSGKHCRDERETDWRSTGTLPRRLHSLILLTLRPAESATRRLIVAMARGINITVRHTPSLEGRSGRDRNTPTPNPSPQGRKTRGGVRGGGTLSNVLTLRPPKSKSQPDYIEIHPSNVARNGGPGIILPPNTLKRIGPDNTVEMYLIPKNTPASPPPAPRRKATARARSVAFPLLDLLQSARRSQRRFVPAHAAPRIWTPGVTVPHQRPFAPPSPSPYDQIEATRLAQRLAVLGAALNSMPTQALRFARWKARRDLGRTRRSSPLRPGRPPGARLSQWNPDNTISAPRPRSG